MPSRDERKPVNQAQKAAFFGIFAALAVIMGYVEALIPLPLPVPGIKLGFANIVTVSVLYLFDAPMAFGVSFIRVLVLGFLFGNLTSILYSLAGMLAAMIVMVLLSGSGRFSVFGVSAGGGAAHGIGQIAAAALLIGDKALLYYIPVLMISGTLCGLVTGFASSLVLRALHAEKPPGNTGCESE